VSSSQTAQVYSRAVCRHRLDCPSAWLVRSQQAPDSERRRCLAVISIEYPWDANEQTLAKTLQERSSPSLRLTTRVFEGETHASMLLRAFSEGLRVVLS
jgi:hypothetical protein